MSFKTILLVLCFALITFIIIFFKDTIIAHMHIYKLLPTEEPLTELYIEDYDRLPTKIVPNKSYPFVFTIHNHENQTTTYPFRIEEVASGEARLISRGAVSIEDTKLLQIKKTYKIRRPVRTKIIVTLENKNQSIHFWVN